MRVHELGRALGLPVRDVIARLRADGEWVDSHLSVVPQPVVNRYLPERVLRHEKHPARVAAPDAAHRPRVPVALPAAPIRRLRRRPGPRPLTMRRWTPDEYLDPLDELRYASELTTRDVANLLGVTRWVARGYLSPIDKLGPSNVFSATEVVAAHEKIKGRRKATGKPRRSQDRSVELQPGDRIRPKHHDAVVTIDEAARLIQVRLATIRSWIHRGHLKPLPSSQPRAIRLRLGDVIQTARSRRLPERQPRRAQLAPHRGKS